MDLIDPLDRSGPSSGRPDGTGCARSVRDAGKDCGRPYRLLRRSPTLGQLGEPILQSMARAATVRTVSRGDRIWTYGAPADRFAVVCTGLVKLVTPGATRGTLLNVFGPGDSLGLPAALQRGGYIADAFAVTDSELLLIPAESTIEAIERNPTAAVAVWALLLEHGRMLHRKITIQSAGTVPRRLATALLQLEERFGDEAADGTRIIGLALSREELAQLIDATVESTIRGMRALEKAGVVATTADGFSLLNPATIERLARGEDSLSGEA